MSTSIQKQAARDAEQYARAYMSYGEGAGNSRKLIYGTVQYKIATLPGYEEAFRLASSRQNMARFAKEAERADRRRTINQAVTRNTRALMTGRYENLNSAIFLGGTALYFAHRHELDKKVVEKAKTQWRKIKNRYRKDNVHDITSA